MLYQTYTRQVHIALPLNGRGRTNCMDDVVFTLSHCIRQTLTEYVPLRDEMCGTGNGMGAIHSLCNILVQNESSMILVLCPKRLLAFVGLIIDHRLMLR